MINFRKQWRGHLWRERFASFPTDETYALNAARHIELNPVRAKLRKDPSAYRWSSARAHIREYTDPILNIYALLRLNSDWAEFLRNGIDQHTLDAIHLHENTGGPLGNPNFIAKIEARLGENP
jgi:putative transposase